MTCTIHTTHFKGCSFTLYEYTSYKPEATTCSCTNTAHVGLLLLATPPGLGVVIPAHVYMYIYILFYIYRYHHISVGFNQSPCRIGEKELGRPPGSAASSVLAPTVARHVPTALKRSFSWEASKL